MKDLKTSKTSLVERKGEYFNRTFSLDLGKFDRSVFFGWENASGSVDDFDFLLVKHFTSVIDSFYQEVE